MAKKDFDIYFDNIQKTYVEMNLILQKFLKEIEEGKIKPEDIEQFKSSMTPIVNNYGVMCQVKLLLDQPQKKEKINKWKKQNKKFISKCDDQYKLDNLVKENNESLERLRDMME